MTGKKSKRGEMY